MMELHRIDWEYIEHFVAENAKVLDLGCGDGSLLNLLKQNKSITARGVEIDQKNILSCLEKGISVFQSDLDEGLSDYGDKSFDYVILSLTLQVVYEPEMLLKEMLRVGKKVIVSIPNFGHLNMRLHLLFTGESPKACHLPYNWFNTPNIRTVSVADFTKLCKIQGIKIEKVNHTCISRAGIYNLLASVLPNLFSEVSIFLLS